MSHPSRDPAANESIPKTDPANEALDLLVEALELIDSIEGPGDVGAHLDLAIHRLRDWIALRTP